MEMSKTPVAIYIDLSTAFDTLSYHVFLYMASPGLS